MAAAAGIFEGRIPGQQQALESSGFRVAAGRIRERFAADPEREGLESARLGIRGGDLSRQLEGLLGGRTLIGGVVAQREAALTAANARLAGTPAPSGNWAPSSGDARFEAGRGVEIARERLTQAQALQASLFSPAARAFEKAGTAGLAEEEEIAGKDYLRAYSLRLAPQVGQSFASFGQGPGAPSGVPGKSGEVMNVRIISMDAEVRRALDGVNSLPP